MGSLEVPPTVQNMQVKQIRSSSLTINVQVGVCVYDPELRKIETG